MAVQRLIIFTRFPEPFKTKTRLIPALGPEGAAQLQRSMTAHMLDAVRRMTEDSSLAAEVRFEGGDANKMAAFFGDDVSYVPQGPGDLGCRMERAFTESCRHGAERSVLIGTDCPDITSDLLREAFQRLETSDLVLGPAQDGGYYLIGLRQPAPRLFERMVWGGDQVLNETLRRARELALDVSLLKTLSDVDRLEDLEVWRRVQSSSPQTARRISVVIPTLNEAGYLPLTLCSLRRAAEVEVLVVDGGSTDGTCELAEREGCHLLHSPPGRAMQMNAGARAASGSVLLFLHADTCLPPGFDRAVESALEGRNVAAGAFRLRIGVSGWPLRVIERTVDFRSRVLQMPYGDQAIFLNCRTFWELGGFPRIPIMEDFELVRRLRRRGQIRILPLAVQTSGRRWKKLGPWRTTWINQKITLGHCFGVSADRLAAWYRDVSELTTPKRK